MSDIPAKPVPRAEVLRRQAKSDPARLGGRLRRLRTMFRALGGTVFSSLVRRILVLNLAALIVLVTGILYLNQFREGLIDARVESLMTQGEIIAAAIAASASVDTDTLRIDPEKLLELQAGEQIAPTVDALDAAEFAINPERVAPVLRQLISPTRTRARIYDRETLLILDSRHLYSGGQVLRFQLDPIATVDTPWMERLWNRVAELIYHSNLPVYQERPGATGTEYPEVMAALEGRPSTSVRISEESEIIVTVAVPVQRFRAVLGALQLSTQGGDIDKIVWAERVAIVRVFLVAAVVTAILSLLLASTIATPLRQLSAAALRVKRGVASRQAIPDFSFRRDEIGHLSVAVRDMTEALYDRMDAIESFAADVAHELKNPLTSLRSAVETLPKAKTDAARARLLEIIQHDVRRLDRLITDISDASRLDAEMNRDELAPLDVAALVRDIVAVAQQLDGENRPTIRLTSGSGRDRPHLVRAHELRLGQVINNIIDNARSFVPSQKGIISVTVQNEDEATSIIIEDNGPGIAAENVERVFERFYTDRPGIESFGQNSGLGLSISRQIVEGHGGTLTAGRSERLGGAAFTIRLPAFKGEWPRNSARSREN